MNYTLVAYKENSVDSCRNCVMERYDSDLQIRYADTQEAIAKQWAELEGKKLQRGETDYEYTLLGDGVDITWSDERDAIRVLVDAELTAIKTEEERQKQEAAARAQAAAAQAAARAAIDKENAERVQYEKLHAKFGPQNSNVE
jgi:regulator of protease activity HflC (stomatin/prohibitin superfamily)